MTEQPGIPGVTADAVAQVVGTVPVVRLHEQSVVGTHMPGRRVPGVRVDGRDVEVHAAVMWPTTVDQAAAAIRSALAVLPVGRVDVTIDDVVLPDDSPDTGSPPEVLP